MDAALPFQAWCHVPHKGFYHKKVNDWPVNACWEGRFFFCYLSLNGCSEPFGKNWQIFTGFRPQILLINQSKCLQSYGKIMCGWSLPGWVSVMRQCYKVYSTVKLFYLFSRRALLSWNGLPGGSRPVLVGDLAGEHPEKDSSIYLALSQSFTELRNWHLYYLLSVPALAARNCCLAG